MNDALRAGLITSTLVSAIQVAVVAPAFADDLEEGGQLYAIQNRKHLVSHEFDVGLGLMPLDAFYKGITTSFTYTYHFSDLWAWEIVHGAYSFNLNTSLREDLQTNFGVQPTEFPEIRVFGGTNWVVKPMYGKFAFLNDQLMYVELFALAGPALAEYENAGIFVGFQLGGGARLYLNKYFTVRFDVRNYGFVHVEGVEDFKTEVHLQAGIGLNIP